MSDDFGDNPGCPVASALNELQEILTGPDQVKVDATTLVGQHEAEDMLKALIAMTGKVCVSVITFGIITHQRVYIVYHTGQSSHKGIRNR